MNELVQGQVINIDGKCLRGSDDKYLGKRAVYMASAWAEANELVLGQRKVDGKSNEITAIPELLKLLAIAGCIVDPAQGFKYAAFENAKDTHKGHGRIEVQDCWSTSNPEYLSLIRPAQNWTGLQSIAMALCTRIVGDKQT